MRWGANRTVETDGILAVHQIVNAHGSILRKFDQGTDIGIDATLSLRIAHIYKFVYCIRIDGL